MVKCACLGKVRDLLRIERHKRDNTRAMPTFPTFKERKEDGIHVNNDDDN